ncbi:MAG: GatB/YqeY domain-containing protein [Thermoanaerobacteraceae bacterium]|nr:GatB/YqeY domain-containing protein [Thermoanaerobacteraceae bacterium]
MALLEQLQADVKAAMKAREAGKLRLRVLRMVMAAVKNKQIETKKELTDEDILDVIAKEVKTRRESLAEFEKAGRDSEVKQLRQEIDILSEYLPEQLSEEELRRLVKEVIAEVGADSMKDMGKVMGAIIPKVKGKADGKLVNQIVREILS